MSAADILTENLPDYFKPVAEFRQIIKAQGFELDKLESVMIHIRNNNYIQSADESALTYYEMLLGFTANPSDTPDYRRARILSMIARDAPFSIGFLNQQLTNIYGADGYILEVDSRECRLRITIITDVYGAIELFYDFIWDIIPAHICLNVDHVITNQTDATVHCGGIVDVTETIDINPYRMLSHNTNEKLYYGGALGVMEKISLA